MTIRRHFELEHAKIYFDLVNRLNLCPAKGQPKDVDNEPFSLEHWIGLLIDWIVSDDQVCPFL